MAIDAALRKRYGRWKKDIMFFSEDCLRFKPTSWQTDLLQAVEQETITPDKKRLCVASCQGAGKSAALGVAALWRTAFKKQALTYITAPKISQCSLLIDETARHLQRAHPVIGQSAKVFATKIEFDGNPRWAIRSVTATKPENLAGIHAHSSRLTFIADELSGIPRRLMETVFGTLSGPTDLVIGAGNPTNIDAPLFDAFHRDPDLWHLFRWDGEDCARERPDLVDPKRNQYFADTYGIESNVYAVRVKAQFPTGGAHAIIPMVHVNAATHTHQGGLSRIADMIRPYHAIGVDLARFGQDQSCIMRRQGLAIVEHRLISGWEPKRVLEEAMRMQERAGIADSDLVYVVDAGGIGGGAMATLYDENKPVHEFHFGGAANRGSMFGNKVTEGYFYVQRLFREGIIHIPKESRLISELSTREYILDKHGRPIAESKDQWRDRRESDVSCDMADAFILAFYPYAAVEARISRLNR
jgi:phage terminase large subunit